MEGPYRVVRVAENAVEEEINSASADGWDVVAAFVSRLLYGLGGEYQAKEVRIILRRREQIDPSPPD